MGWLNDHFSLLTMPDPPYSVSATRICIKEMDR